MLKINRPTLYLLRGLPGSGKSTVSTELAIRSFSYICEADNYFYDETGEYKFDASKLKDAHEYCQNSCKDALIEGYNAVVSNTSTTEKEVETYRKIAEDCNANFISLIVENRHGNSSIHNVPEDKIQQMKNRFSVKL